MLERLHPLLLLLALRLDEQRNPGVVPEIKGSSGSIRGAYRHAKGRVIPGSVAKFPCEAREHPTDIETTFQQPYQQQQQQQQQQQPHLYVGMCK